MKNSDFRNRTFVSMSYNEKDNPWTIDIRTGILERLNKDKKSYIYTSFQCVSENTISDNFDVLENNKRLFFLPGKFKSRPAIISIDLQEMIKKETYLIDLPIRENLKDEIRFTGMITVGEYVYYIPFAYPAIIRVDTRNLSLTYIDKWKAEIDERIDSGSRFGYFIARQYVIKDEFLYVPFLAIAAVLKININTLDEKILYLDVESEGFSCICEWNNCFLLSGTGHNKDRLYLWNEDSGKVDKEWKVQETSEDYPVIKMLVSEEGDVFVFPWENWGCYDVDIYKLNRKNLQLKKMNLLPRYEDYRETKCLWGDEVINAHWISKDTFLFVTGRDYKWHEYNVDTKEHLEYEVFLDETDENIESRMKEYFRLMADYRKPIHEDEFGLKAFVNTVM